MKFLQRFFVPRPRGKNANIARAQARKLVTAKLQYWNQFYKYSYNKIFIRRSRSKWGSCSSLKNLGFNYKIIYLPGHLIDYIIVHELCHLEQMNHSKDFWTLVAKTIPEWKNRRKELRNIHL